MFDYAVKLATGNNYYPIDLDINMEETSILIGEDLKDILIISVCSREEVMSFFTNQTQKASHLMGMYDNVLNSEYADSAKDMHLVICHKIDSVEQLDLDKDLKHQIMQLEENKYGMRISVLKYTNEGLEPLNTETDLITVINNKVDSSINTDEEDFSSDKTIDAALKVEPSFTALQFYTKLPFLSLRNFESSSSIEPIESRFRTIIGGDSSLIERVSMLKEYEYASLTPEEFLNKLESELE